MMTQSSYISDFVHVGDVCYSRYFELAPQQGWSIVFAAVCPCALSGFFTLSGIPAGQLRIRAGWASIYLFIFSVVVTLQV